jgi:pimeloyl-ACP methyl ester carboxylesterase
MVVETAAQRVDIGGRSLVVEIEGHGFPAVVLVSGLGMDRRQWRGIVPRLARWTTVLAYDRAGMGESDPPPGPRGFEGPAEDLAALLDASGVPPPFFVRLYAHRHPEKIAGLVLIDPHCEGRRARVEALLPPEAIARNGDGMAATRQRIGGGELLEADPTAVSALMATAWPLPPVPSALLVHGLPEERFRPEELPLGVSEAIWRELYQDLVRRLPDCALRVAERSRHFIPQDQAELVVAAIAEVVEVARRDYAERLAALEWGCAFGIDEPEGVLDGYDG